MNNQIISLLEKDRFVEVLYYASIQETQNGSVDNELMLGLACCAAIRPLANMLRRQDGEDAPPGGYAISRKTKIVGNGYLHLEQSLLNAPELVVPETLTDFCQRVRRDLIVYGSQEFRFTNEFNGQFTLAEATWGAISVIDRMGVPALESGYRKFYLYQWGSEFVEKRLTMQRNGQE